MFAAYKALTVLLVTISITAWLTRIYIRVIKGKQCKAVEFTLACAVIVQIALLGCHFRKYDAIASVGEDASNVVLNGKLLVAGGLLYFTALWAVKISISLLHIQLTKGVHWLPWLPTLAICTFWLMCITPPIIYIVFFVGCLPVSRRWALPTERGCPPIVKEFDFWVYNAIHLSTDIIRNVPFPYPMAVISRHPVRMLTYTAVCILPYPVLISVLELRLRIAICVVYSLGIISIAVTITRIVLLATDAQHSATKIMILSQAEVTTCIVIGVLPGISRVFAKKYLQGSSAPKDGAGRIFSRDQPSLNHGDASERNEAEFIELPSRPAPSSPFVDVEDGRSLNSSRAEGVHVQ